MNVPGGKLLSGQGGYLQFWDWKAPIGFSSPPIPANFRWLDVAYWRLVKDRHFAVTQYSGCEGQRRRRGVVVDWKILVRVWWDYRRPPQQQIEADGVAIKLKIGNDVSWIGNLAAVAHPTDFNNPANPGVTNDETAAFPQSGAGLLDIDEAEIVPCYVAPLCVLTMQEMLDDSQAEGGDDGIVYQDIVISGDSRLWYIGAVANIGQYGTYLTRLAQHNRIPYVL